jgi:hypothetical protein
MIGRMLVGLDEQLMRSEPRAEILVKRSTQLRLEGDAAGDLVIHLPAAGPLGKPPSGRVEARG